MSEHAKHTPGPWSVFVCDDGGEWTGWPLSISADRFTDKTVVRPGGFYPYEWDAGVSQNEAVANALLIAAAPDMYEALKDTIDLIEDGIAVQDEINWTILGDRIRSLIAKAEGQP